MDTLSSSPLTTFHVHKPSKPTHLPNLKPPIPHHHHHHHPSATAKATATSSLSTLQQKDNYTPLNPFYPKKTSSSSILPPLTRYSSPPRVPTHHRAASGYAAALLDVAQCKGTLLKVERDVKRLLKLLRNDQVKEFMMDDMVVETAKVAVVKELVDKGKFEKNFVGLVKLVINKGKTVQLVEEVLEEFQRVFSQLAAPNAPPPRLAVRI